jgi:hypothetical protein
MCKGFGIRLGRESKAFFAERWLLGKTKRITIDKPTRACRMRFVVLLFDRFYGAIVCD